MATVTHAAPAVNGREAGPPTKPARAASYTLSGTYQVVNGRIVFQIEADPFLDVVAWDAQIPIAESEQVMTAAPPPVNPRTVATHAPGFASVNWYGTLYHFTPKQRAIISMLWQAGQDGCHCVGTSELMRAADSDGDRLRDVFDHGRHPAWNILVVKGMLHGGRSGTWRLAPPPGTR